MKDQFTEDQYNKGFILADVNQRLEEQEVDISYRKVESVYNAIMDTIRSMLYNGKKVTLKNFCVLEVRESKATVGRNPKTQEKLNIPAKYRIKLSESVELRRILDAKKNGVAEGFDPNNYKLKVKKISPSKYVPTKSMTS